MTGARLLLSAAFAMSMASLAHTQSRAQSYPVKPIKLVVPFPAGGTIGARQVASAAPDGYTLMMGSLSTFGTHPVLYKLDYDPMKAFAPVASAVVDKLVMVAGPALQQVKTVQELVAYAKANPGKLNYGNAIGIGPHFTTEMFKIKAGVDIVHIPYRGGAPMITDLIAGQIHMTINGKSVLLQHIAAGKVRPLAVTSARRWTDYPQIPTLLEVGYLERPYDTLFGVVAPAGTPAAIIAKLNATINDGLRSAETRATLEKLGIEPLITTPEEFAALIAEEAPKWAEAVRQTGIKIE